METTDVILRREGALGRITLNRPKALNALTLEMCAAMFANMQDWARDPQIRAVVIDSEGRAFAAGGDVRAVYDAGKKRDGSVMKFFSTEYPLNVAIRHFPKPYMALINGIAMGGGLGVSMHGSHRVLGENAILAMPETAIGLFPDVGASYFLNRLPGQLGMYLALTGERLGPADAIYCQLATHFVRAERFADITARLARSEAPDTILAGLAQDPGNAELAQHRPMIDRAFAAASVEQVLDALLSEGEWGRGTRDLLLTRSPTSLKLTFRQIREAVALDFDSCMRREYRMVTRVMAGHDFYEGVRAALIDKDQSPLWKPPNLAQVGEEEINRYFAPLGSLELKL